MKYLLAIRKLSWKAGWMLLKAGWVVFAIKVALKTVPYKKVLTKIEGGLRSSRMKATDQRFEERAVWAVRAIARRFLGDKPCLTQALALKWILARAGKKTTLKIGVNKNLDNALEAHAWLELDGEIIIGGRNSPVFYTTLGTAVRQKSE